MSVVFQSHKVELPAISIEPAKAGDEAAIANVYVAGQHLAYDKHVPSGCQMALSLEEETATWQHNIADKTNFLYVARAPQGIVGFTNGGVNPNKPHVGAFTDAWLLAAWHSSGLAPELALAVIRSMRAAGATEMWAKVLLGNAAAEGFCKKIGGKYQGYIAETLIHVTCGDGLVGNKDAPFGQWKWESIAAPLPGTSESNL